MNYETFSFLYLLDILSKSRKSAQKKPVDCSYDFYQLHLYQGVDGVRGKVGGFEGRDGLKEEKLEISEVATKGKKIF
jgi:hypothetical protein